MARLIWGLFSVLSDKKQPSMLEQEFERCTKRPLEGERMRVPCLEGSRLVC